MLSTIKNLPNNNRFYVLVYSFLLSIFLTCLLRLRVADNQLYYIQLEQVFGFLALAFLYMTLIISPVQKIIGTPEWMKNVIFARRATGVSVVYFALLHTGITLWGELDGIGGLALLPDRFIWPLICGTAALAILCILAISSFDKVILFLGYHRWKWLERLVYLCGILIITHIWIIGVHFAPGVIRDVCLAALALLFGLESWRIAGFLCERRRWSKTIHYFLFTIVWFLGMLPLGWLAASRTADAHMLIKDAGGKTGTVLHVTPDDDPVAGERSSLIFDIQTPSPGNEPLTAKLTIVDDRNHEAQVPAHVQESTVEAAYTFPRQGLYTVILSMYQGDRQTHRFMESQRVSRGVINNVTVHRTPLWAGLGMLCTAMTAIAVTIIAFSRRKTISAYSKL